MDPKDKAPATHSQPDKTCGNCRYAKDRRSWPGMLQCRRFPPTTDTDWPLVEPQAWCGEFKAEKGAYDFNTLEG